MRHADLIAAAGDGFALVVADVGSLGGLHLRWRPFRSVVAGVLFDPREEQQAANAPTPGRDFIRRTALGDSEGEATLFVTRRHTMTSTLRPDPALMPRFLGKAAHTEIISEETLKVRPFDAVAAEAGLRPDVLKIDIQGGELGVLKGAAGSLKDSVLFVEVEVSFFERYIGQPVFREIETFLAGLGFEFIDFYRMKRYRHVNAARIDILRLGRRQHAGRLAFADAFFMLREEVAAERMAALSEGERASFVLKAVMILVAYGKADLAARWFDLFGGVMAQSARDQITKAFRKIRRRRFGPGYLHRLFDYVDRRI
jgi:FkbM family methyltransferase